MAEIRLSSGVCNMEQGPSPNYMILSIICRTAYTERNDNLSICNVLSLPKLDDPPMDVICASPPHYSYN